MQLSCCTDPLKLRPPCGVKNWLCFSPPGMLERTGLGRGTECQSSLDGTPGLVPLLLRRNPSLDYSQLLPPGSDTHTHRVRNCRKTLLLPSHPIRDSLPVAQTMVVGRLRPGKAQFHPGHQKQSLWRKARLKAEKRSRVRSSQRVSYSRPTHTIQSTAIDTEECMYRRWAAWGTAAGGTRPPDCYSPGLAGKGSCV